MSYTFVNLPATMRRKQDLLIYYSEHESLINEFIEGVLKLTESKLDDIIDKENKTTSDLTVTITKSLATTNKFGQSVSSMNDKTFCELCRDKIVEYFKNAGFEVPIGKVSKSGNYYDIKYKISWKLDLDDDE